MTGIEQAISQGVTYLHQHQYPHGEFCCYISGDDAMQGWTVADSAIFPTALISYSLHYLPASPEIDKIQMLANQFLESQMHYGGVWNYFATWNRYYSVLPCDVDDTVCSSIVLNLHSRNYHWINKPIILANRNKRGLFYTWFVIRPAMIRNKSYWRVVFREVTNPIKSFFFWLRTECNRNDIDAVVNANALYYLGETEDTQPVIHYLLSIIAENREHHCDKWYHNPFTVYYFLSRNFHAGVTKLEPAREPVIARILSKVQENGQIGNTILDTALAVSTLLNWGYSSAHLDNAIRFLINAQMGAGHWPREILYYGGPKKLFGYGSEELTTGFCLEALARYHRSLQKQGL